MIGVVIWGLAYAGLAPKLRGAPWLRGVELATGAWLLMMLAIMPMAGAGLFGLRLGLMAPVATLMMHGIYGAVLAGFYCRQFQKPAVEASHSAELHRV